MKNDTTKICSVSSCQRGGRLKRGMCSLHYQRWLNSSESVGVKNKPGRRSTFTPDGLKVCVACDEAKELTEFHKDRSGTGGSHTFINTALACHQCNVSKNDKTVEEWEAWKAGGSFGREETTTSGESCKAWRDGTAVLF